MKVKHLIPIMWIITSIWIGNKVEWGAVDHELMPLFAFIVFVNGIAAFIAIGVLIGVNWNKKIFK